MPLSKSKGNMYPWVTRTHTHLAGECSHRCAYCYVQAMERRWHSGRYSGPLRLVEDELAVKYGKGKTIFVEHCNDLWAKDVPSPWIAEVMEHCRRWPGNEYVFQTKNPARYREWLKYMPPRRLLGCTIETTADHITDEVSRAPWPVSRYQAMSDLYHSGERVFVTIEPILKGSMELLAKWCAIIRPEFVNIGADSKGHNLPEPSAADVRLLIAKLTEYGVPIREKRNLGRLLGEASVIGDR